MATRVSADIPIQSIAATPSRVQGLNEEVEFRGKQSEDSLVCLIEQEGQITTQSSCFKEDVMESFKQVLLRHDYEQLLSIGYRQTSG